MPAVILAAALVAVLLSAVLPDGSPVPGVSTPPDSSSTASPTPEGSGSPTVAPSPDAPLQVASYVGPAYDLNVVATPTEWTSQSKTWFNDNSWWALMATGTAGRVHIHELNWESQHWVDTGVPVDERPFARHEALWDGESLHVAGSGSRNTSTHAVRYARFAYDAEARRYVLQPDFPRALTSGGVGAISLAPGANEQVWMVTVEARRPMVRSSANGGTTWSSPFDLSAAVGSSAAERASVVATPTGTAVAWTTLDDNELHVAQHVDGEPEDEWTVDSIAVDGLIYGEDDLSLRSAADGSIIAAVRTSLDRVENRNLDAPQIMVLRLRDGRWSESLAARVRDRLTGPQLVVDDANGSLYLFGESEGDVRVKRADLETLAFESGSGTLAIASSIVDSLDPASQPTTSPTPAGTGTTASPAPELPELGEVTSTKQRLDGLTEIIALASDDVSGRYAHAVVALPGGRAGPTAAGHAAPLPEGVTPGLPAGATAFVLRDSFAPYPNGPAAVSGWLTRDLPAEEVATIVTPSENDPALRLLPEATGSGARACKTIPEAARGVLIVGVTAQTRGTLDSDATITHLRSPEGLSVTVRFGEPGVFRYFAGDQRVNSPAAWAAGTWYRSIVRLDFAAQTYSWEVTPLGGDAPILSVASLPLRVPAASVSEVCAESGNELPGGSVELLVDDVTVEVGPGG